MIKRRCIHYRHFGDYSLDQCFKDAGLPNFRVETEFDCRNCPDYRTKSSGLMKCPFCGSRPIIFKEHDIGNEWKVTCWKCSATIRANGADEATQKWNTRK